MIRLRDLTLEITRVCVNRCMHCSSRAISETRHMPLNPLALLGVIDEATALGLQSLAISGGEPFISPLFRSVIEKCSESQIRNLMIYTSGVVWSQDGIPAPLGKSLLRAVSDSGALLIFSIYSLKPEVHDKIVGAPGRLQLSIESIKRAMNIGIPVECHIVPNLQNVTSLASTAQGLINLGAQRVSFLRLVPQGYAKKNIQELLLTDSALAYMKAEFRKLLSEDGADTKYRFGTPFSNLCGNTSCCNAGISKLIMRWDGTFFPCEAFKECGQPEFVLGRLGQMSLRTMLELSAKNASLRSLRIKARDIDPCPAQYLYS